MLSLLGGLTAEDWLRPTAAKKWNVKEVALHLLGGDISNLSRRRDAYAPPGAAISGWDDLVIFINGLNEPWVGAARRIVPLCWANCSRLSARKWTPTSCRWIHSRSEAR